jgi:hypothetical protein
VRLLNLWLKYEDGSEERLEETSVDIVDGSFELRGRRWRTSHAYYERDPRRGTETRWVVCLDRGAAGEDSAAFADDEYVLLDDIVELALYAFREIAQLREGEPPDDVERAMAILSDFLRRDLTEVLERAVSEDKERMLSPQEATAAISDPLNWSDPFKPLESPVYHEVDYTDVGRTTYIREYERRCGVS